MNIRIPVSSPLINEDDINSVTKCLKSGWVSSLGEDVLNFEKAFSSYQDAKYGVSTNSGTTALHLALASLNLKENDEIIMPTFTMIATINAAEYLKLKVKLIDANIKTWTMDTEALNDKITNKTKAIMAVHIYGHPENMMIVDEIAKEHDLLVIEDAAEAHGAEINGKKVGTFGEVGSFSFYANKIITTGEGGMNVTNNQELAERMAWLRAHAFGRGGKHFWHEELGYGYRMSALQAALGVSQVRKIDQLVQKRRTNAKLYNEMLQKLSDKNLLVTPKEETWAKNVYWMYSILADRKHRDSLMAFLGQKGIETRTFFYPIHKQPYYRQRYSDEAFPVADELSSRGINLPSGNLLDEEDIIDVCSEINNYFTGI
ncbi:MAG: DegT/DnrJ/EryC1/StrS family aminotransferase [Thermoplasmatales archaeon]|nr:DegT/DnrJ/EryC1/StrS family aminotransferase [Thermoplasmatales archaeon]MCW6170420.1 DegT/DnrJ/EryC1/StrS family aminotransferase [Thermoplasmatales archaeon]